MFTNCHTLDIFDYICTQNAQCLARITKSDMEIQRYYKLYEIARHMDVDVKVFLVSSKKLQTSEH